MIVLLLCLAAGGVLTALVMLGWVPDTREPGRYWYPATPDDYRATPDDDDCPAIDAGGSLAGT